MAANGRPKNIRSISIQRPATWAVSGIGFSAPLGAAVAALLSSTAGQSLRAVTATGWPTLLSEKSRGIVRRGGQIVSATKWAGPVAFWKAVTGASPRGCTGAPMSGFAGNMTPSQIAPWSGSWITCLVVSKIGEFRTAVGPKVVSGGGRSKGAALADFANATG